MGVACRQGECYLHLKGRITPARPWMNVICACVLPARQCSVSLRRQEGPGSHCPLAAADHHRLRRQAPGQLQEILGRRGAAAETGGTYDAIRAAFAAAATTPAVWSLRCRR